MTILNAHCIVINPEGPQTPNVPADAGASYGRVPSAKVKRLTLTPSAFLLSKLLAAAEGEKKETAFQHELSQSPEPQATLTCSEHISQVRLSSNSRCKKKKKKNPTAENPRSAATDALDGIITCAGKLLYYILIHL